MMELNIPRNKEYCKRHDFDANFLVGILSEQYGDYSKGSWVKAEMIRDALKKDYEYVVFLEPDTLIKDMDTDLRDGCPKHIGVCYHRHPIAWQWNVGAIYMRNTPETKAFVDEWLAEFPGDPQWRDNGALNVVAKRNKSLTTISDRWNATLDCSMVPDAVVLGFHGVGMKGEDRLRTMKQMLERI